MKRLLDDVFYKFNECYKQNKSLDPSIENVTAKYPWYYLNTHVTNTVGGRVYLVGGQQHLTTLMLILIKLRRLSQKFKSEHETWIASKIAGHSGRGATFWVNHDAHRSTQQALFDGENPDGISTESGLTAQNLVANFKLVDARLDSEFSTKHEFESFRFCFMTSLGSCKSIGGANRRLDGFLR